MTARERRLTVESLGGTYTNRITDIVGHEMLADEPVELGGADRGPSPFELVAAGLGACTSITLMMYAKNKGIALRDVRVVVRFFRAGEDGHAGDHADRAITLYGALDEKAQQRLAAIAKRCPVHLLLERAIAIADTVTVAP